jgi:hypothetical protein
MTRIEANQLAEISPALARQAREAVAIVREFHADILRME